MESSVAVASCPTPPHTNCKSLFPWARLVLPSRPSTQYLPYPRQREANDAELIASGRKGLGASIHSRHGPDRGRRRGGQNRTVEKANRECYGASAVVQDHTPFPHICRFRRSGSACARAIWRSSGAGRVLASLVARARGPGVLADGSHAFWVLACDGVSPWPPSADRPIP